MSTETPKDYEDPACSSGMRCWVTAYFFGNSQREVEEKKERYKKKYPTFGYSTQDVNPPFQKKNGFWYGMMRRFSSCD